MPENTQIVSNGRASAERLNYYFALASAGNFQKLYEEIQANTRDPKAHPNHVLIFAVLMMAGRQDIVSSAMDHNQQIGLRSRFLI